ncbi:RNA helicase [Teratosphaeriaceae sp. CCFEE 6253]|nr:RNA helicase [Teratosphaeriaceae sp. CCFEE 6253]
MNPAQRQSGRCVYCAFRTQQRALQARRLRSTAATERIQPHDAAPLIRFTDRSKKADAPATPDAFPRSFFRVQLEKGKQRGSSHSGKEPFDDVLPKQLDVIQAELRDAPFVATLQQDEAEGAGGGHPFDRLWSSFKRNVLRGPTAVPAPWTSPSKDNAGAKELRSDLADVYRLRGVRGLQERIKYAFYGQVASARFTAGDISNQQALADLRYPAEWFPATRALHRTVHLHVGPTNSGKTYQALKRLEAAKSGCYAGPLRLLAHEVYSRMNAQGRSCALVTGDERRIPVAATAIGPTDLMSCTVEMMPLNRLLDVAVIDEIQMISSPDRGWAWTAALMGVMAREVHLCGEERTVPLIRELCASVGDKLEIHKYERLSPLQLAPKSLSGDLRQLRKGDCIVSFSIMGIHALRKQIERQTGRKVATVYGSLPPETRAQQARLFNDPDNEYDYLVASDAVGMGLNLAIKRIIFEASSKFDGTSIRTLGIADIKQIAGRAGRYRTAAFNTATSTATQHLAAGEVASANKAAAKAAEKESVGLVTTLENFDFPVIAAAMSADAEPIRTAGLYPPAAILERFASYFPPGTPFSYILTRLHELSQMHSRFHLCGLKDQIWIADLIEPVRNLTVSDRNVLCSAPASTGDDMWRTLMPAYARCIADQNGGSLVEIKELPLETLEAEVGDGREYLRALERLHKGIVAYLWLSYRFAGIFSTRGMAFHVKEMVEERIETVLGKFSFSEVERRKKAAGREKGIKLALEQAAQSAAAENEDVEGGKAGEGGAAGLGREGEEGAEVNGEAGVTLRNDGGEQDGSLISGGDRFAGEEDVVLEEPSPAEEPLVEGQEAKAEAHETEKEAPAT